MLLSQVAVLSDLKLESMLAAMDWNCVLQYLVGSPNPKVAVSRDEGLRRC